MIRSNTCNLLFKSYRLTAFIITMVTLSSCASLKEYRALPQNLENHASIPGFTNVRAWGDQRGEALDATAIESLQQEMAYNHGKLLSHVDALALSGGGADGAFGAGLIYGWSKSGKMPKFKIVTGISTGALMAPLVFLSPQYDYELKRMYTSLSDKDIYKQHSIFTIIMGLANIQSLSSLADTKPLASVIAKLVDKRMLQRIAREHKKGRRLLIGTTQLDAQRLVIWNMGAIASSHHPGALELFRKIMLASASIPVTFPPQYFEIQADGKMYQEMHVDGGVAAQTMLFENALYPFSGVAKLLQGQNRDRDLYIIRNDKVLPVWEDVHPTIKDIATRSISSLIRSQGTGDFYRLYAYTQRYGFNYNLAFIPSSFHAEAKGEFDSAYMKKLFLVGEKLGSQGYEWHKAPPGFETKVS
jgi:hypothetical protein